MKTCNIEGCTNQAWFDGDDESPCRDHLIGGVIIDPDDAAVVPNAQRARTAPKRPMNASDF